jgi:hypothetical protein
LTSSGTLIPVTSAVYDASALTVTLTPSELLNIHDVYQLTVTGTPPDGLTGSTGVELAGNGTTPGTNFVTTISGQNLAGAAPSLRQTDPKRFAAETKILATVDRKLKTEPNYRANIRRKLASTETKIGALQKRTSAEAKKSAVSTRHVKVVSTSAAETKKSAVSTRHVKVSSTSAAETKKSAASAPPVEVLSASAVDALSVSGGLTPAPAPSPVPARDR